jgi:hypothetical protein
MTPKEKANYLTHSYLSIRLDILTKMDSVPCIFSDFPTYSTAKKLAKLAVDLRLEADFAFNDIEYGENSREYWEQVRTEIDKL